MRTSHVCMLYACMYMGGCQNYGPFWGTLYIRCRTIMGTQKGTIILTTTHMYVYACVNVNGHVNVCE